MKITENKDKNQTIYVVGIGPGHAQGLSQEARQALESVDVIVGYPVYLDLLREEFGHKQFLSTPMTREAERCRLCFSKAREGYAVAMVSSGDAGIYGMASLMWEIGEEEGYLDIVVIPGITVASSGGALLGAPINHDFAVVSLSDYLTPWEWIERRLRAAAAGDFCLVLYNPASKRRSGFLARAVEILLDAGLPPSRPSGYVRQVGRQGQEAGCCTLAELAGLEADMFTTVFVGNSQSRIIDGHLVTPRGYQWKS